MIKGVHQAAKISKLESIFLTIFKPVGIWLGTPFWGTAREVLFTYVLLCRYRRELLLVFQRKTLENMVCHWKCLKY